MQVRNFIVGVMGGAQVDDDVKALAYHLGQRIAEQGWILLNGGRDAGVMRASAEGAKSRNGLTIGILRGPHRQEANPYIDIPIVTGMGDARNVINVLSSDVIVALPGSAGTWSEISHAIKLNKPICLLGWREPFPIAAADENHSLPCFTSIESCLDWIETTLLRE